MSPPGQLRLATVKPAWAPRTGRWALGAIVLLALGLRLLQVNFQPLWWDEGWSLYFATTDVATMLRLTAVDIHPPLYYLLLHLWIGVAGSSPVAVRLLSVFIGTATVPLLYLVGRRLFSEQVGLLAALLLAIAPFHIYYSQEVRMYGLVTLFGLVAFFFALELEGGKGGIAAWLAYVIASVAALYTQYYAVFLLLALNLVILARWIRSRRPFRAWLPWLGAQAAVLVLYLPWAVYAGGKLLSYVRYKVGVEADVPLGFFSFLGRHLAAFDWGHAEGTLASWWWLGLLPLAALAGCLVPALWRRSNPNTKSTVRNPLDWPLAILGVALIGGFMVNLVFPFIAPRNERQLLLALPAYLLLAAAALQFAGQRRRLLAILPFIAFVAFGLLSLGFFYTVPRYVGDDYRPVAARLRALARPGDAVVCVHPWQVGYFESYIPPVDRPALVLTPREVLPSARQLWADDPALMAAGLDELLAAHGRLWLPAHQAMGRVLEDEITGYLTRRAYPVLTEWYGQNTVLALFAAGEPVPQAVTARFGSWLALTGASLSLGQVEAGWGVATADLTWLLSERAPDTYSVGLRLVDAAGRIWAQRDAQPVGGLEPFTQWPTGEPRLDRHGLLVPAGTPPGDYRLMLRVYRSGDLAVLPVTFTGGSGGEVALGTVHVVWPNTPLPVAALDIAQPLQADFGVLRLLGTGAIGRDALLPGQLLEADLFWRALKDPGEDYLPRLQLVDASGAGVAGLTEKPVGGSFPTAWWPAGALVRDPHALPIPATAPPGTYRLVLGLVRAADGRPLDVGGGRTAVDLAQVEVLGRDHDYALPMPQHQQPAAFGLSVELVGYDLGEVVRAPGSPLPITLYWHALATPDKNYDAFVHLLDASGEIVAQDDGVPGQGKLPTLGWLAGEYLADTHTLQLPSDLPGGQYHLGVGMYDPATGQRLGERLLLDTAVVIGAD